MSVLQENIDLQSTILSRFDLIFIVKDERSAERDMMIARHVLDVHRLAGAQPEADEEERQVGAWEQGRQRAALGALHLANCSYTQGAAASKLASANRLPAARPASGSQDYWQLSAAWSAA